MSRRTPIALATVSAVALLAAAGTATAAPSTAPAHRHHGPQAPVHVQLLSITDFHSGSPMPSELPNLPFVYADGHKVEVGGPAYLKAHLDKLRATNRLTTTFSNGDNFTAYNYMDKGSNYEHGLDAYNQLGMEFTTVGNHDLDWNVSYLLKHYSRHACDAVGTDDCFLRADGSLYRGVSSPSVSANVRWKDSGALVYQPYVIKTFRGPGGTPVKVGIIGATLAGPETWPMSYNERLTVGDPLPDVNKWADYLSAHGVNAIVVSVHDGTKKSDAFVDTCTGLNGSAYNLALKASPKIDAIITGHTHKVFSCSVPDPAGHPRSFSQAGSYANAINRLDLAIDPKSGEVLRDQSTDQVIPNSTDVTPDAKLVRTQAYWEDLMAKRGVSAVARATAPITRQRDDSGETAFGNLAADAQLWSGTLDPRTVADLALVDTTGTPGWDTVTHDDLIPTKDGVITHENAFQGFGRDMKFVTVTMTGAQIVAALEQQWQATGFLPLAVSKGVHYTEVPSAPAGQRVKDLTINGTAVDPAKAYRVVVSSEDLVQPRHGFTTLTVGTDRISHMQLDNKTFVAYLRHLGTVTPPALDRVDLG